MKSVLVITHCAPQGLPQQGSIVAAHLRHNGVKVRLLGRAKSGWGRLLEVVTLSLFLVPRHDVVLVDVFGLRAFIYESVAIMCARLWQKRIVVFLHNGHMRDFVERWPRWTRFTLSQPNLVLVPHRFLKEQLCPLSLRIDGIIPNFVELKNYRFRERSILAPRFLYLRGTHPIYNAPMVLRAFALIQRDYPDALLTMAGKEGKDSEYCQSLVQSLKLRNVQFLGIVPKEDIPVLADKHDIYLQASRIDNMPVSIIEMWASGLPIVGTNVGGMPYLVRDRQDAILIESEDHQAMADVCFELLSNCDLAATLSHNGRARASELTWESVKCLWEDALGLKFNTTADPYDPGFNTSPITRGNQAHHEEPKAIAER